MSALVWRVEGPTPRLDRFLTERVPEVNRSRWETWIRDGRVLVNGEPVTKPGSRLSLGDTVATEPPPPAPPALHLGPEPMDLPTLFEDARLWIIDKPAGLVVHPGPGHPGGTALNALLARLGTAPAAAGQESGEEGEDDELPVPWPGLVHRLDRYTTGCLCMAKDLDAQASLQAQFKARTVDKHYLALARDSRGLPELGSLLVDAPIARHRLERLRMVVAAAGRPSQTRIRVLARSRGVALVACELLTGRTHQIRVHLRHLGAPILGDPTYGGPSSWLDGDRRAFPLPHPCLHAWRLALDHPGDGRRLEVRADLPRPFLETLAMLGIPPPS